MCHEFPLAKRGGKVKADDELIICTLEHVSEFKEVDKTDMAYKDVRATLEKSDIYRRIGITAGSIQSHKFIKTPFLERMANLAAYARGDAKKQTKDLLAYSKADGEKKVAMCEGLINQLLLEFQGLGSEAATYNLELNARVLRLDLEAQGNDAQPAWLTSPLKTALTDGKADKLLSTAVVTQRSKRADAAPTANAADAADADADAAGPAAADGLAPAPADAMAAAAAWMEENRGQDPTMTGKRDRTTTAHFEFEPPKTKPKAAAKGAAKAAAPKATPPPAGSRIGTANPRGGFHKKEAYANATKPFAGRRNSALSVRTPPTVWAPRPGRLLAPRLAVRATARRPDQPEPGPSATLLEFQPTD